MLRRRNKTEIAVYGFVYHCSGHMAVRMRTLRAISRSCAISFPESAILLVCAKDLDLWDNPCQNSGYSRSDWLLYFTGSSLRAVSFKTGNENVERLLANVLCTSEDGEWKRRQIMGEANSSRVKLIQLDLQSCRSCDEIGFYAAFPGKGYKVKGRTEEDAV